VASREKSGNAFDWFASSREKPLLEAICSWQSAKKLHFCIVQWDKAGKKIWRPENDVQEKRDYLGEFLLTSDAESGRGYRL
jgi:hypothetical protein